LEEKGMKVLILSYQATSVLGGGLLSQVENTFRTLKEMDVDVKLFDQWKDVDLEEFDLCHIFGANVGTYHTATLLHREGIRTIVSPIFFTRRSPGAVRMTIWANRCLDRVGRGIWTHYGIASDICGWAGHVLPNTTDEAAMVIKGLGISSDKVRIVPNGVEERYYHADPKLFRETYGLEKFILSVGFIGMERKNHLRFFRALRDIDLPVVIIGRVWKGPYVEECMKAAEEIKNLTILDPLPPSSDLLASAYAACDLFVLPSLYETPGIAALEAALAGAKIVITPHGGTKDYFSDLVEYVNPYSVTSIHNGIARALESEKGNRLRDLVQSEYTWRRVAEKTLDVYGQIVNMKAH
jgi:glycosyltransferase involved in cell wall biosynthesis